MSRLHARKSVIKIGHMIDEIIAEIPRIQDAKATLGTLALREKVPLTDVINYYLHKAPEQLFHCSRCEEDVPEYDFAQGMCLDCVQADYEEYFKP